MPLVRIYLFGIVLVTPVYVYAFLVRERGHGRPRSSLIAVATVVVLFEVGLQMPLYTGVIPMFVLEFLAS